MCPRLRTCSIGTAKGLTEHAATFSSPHSSSRRLNASFVDDVGGFDS